MNETKIRNYLKVIRKAADLIEEALSEKSDDSLFEEIMMTTSSPSHTPIPKSNVDPRQKHIQDLLSIENWPVAVPAHLEASATNEDQINRANVVLDMMVDRNLHNLDFLDFGCGEGWTAQQALNRGVKTSTGFDIFASPTWKTKQKVHFTNNFRDIADQFYDIIMVYDVLDHCEDPISVMKQIRSLLKPNGTIYIRNHPWTAKHASHLYKQGLNKAYIHLYLTWEELAQQGYNPMFTRQEIDPLTSYRWWFKDFNIERELLRESEIDQFFFLGDFKQLMLEEQKIAPEQEDKFMNNLKLDFVDYVLRQK